MDVIRPIEITDTMLVSSNVPETDAAEWAAGTTYAAGAIVMVTVAGDHHRYESLQAANVGHDPKTSPTWWIDLGATNRWAMFDSSNSTQTSSAGTIEIVLQPGRINALSLVNLTGSKVEVTMTDGATTVYSRTEELQIRNAYDFYTHLYEPYAYKRHVLFNDIPIHYLNGTLTIRISGVPGQGVKCGVCVVGLARYLGDLQWKPTVGIKDFSNKDTDDFGLVTLVKRDFSQTMTCTLWVNNAITDEVYRILTSLRSTPLVWYGSDLFESTVIFGYYDDFSVDIESVPLSTCSLKIIGLT